MDSKPTPSPSGKTQLLMYAVLFGSFLVAEFLLQTLRCSNDGCGSAEQRMLTQLTGPSNLAVTVLVVAIFVIAVSVLLTGLGKLAGIPNPSGLSLFPNWAYTGWSGAVRWIALGAGSAVLEQISRSFPTSYRLLMLEVLVLLLILVLFKLIKPRETVSTQRL